MLALSPQFALKANIRREAYVEAKPQSQATTPRIPLHTKPDQGSKMKRGARKADRGKG
jgi:hypothetical protein